MNVKFHKNCENTGKILKISCVRCNFLKCDIRFLGLIRNCHKKFSLVLLQMTNSYCERLQGEPNHQVDCYLFESDRSIF